MHSFGVGLGVCLEHSHLGLHMLKDAFFFSIYNQKICTIKDCIVDGETLLDYYGKGNQSGFGGVDVQTELSGQLWSTGWSMD